MIDDTGNNKQPAPTGIITLSTDKTIVWDFETEPFGETYATPTNTTPTNHRFPGQYADTEDTLSYNYMRDYDPSLGRYVQADPLGLMAGPNLFGYAGQNPTQAIDPWGLNTQYSVNLGFTLGLSVGVGASVSGGVSVPDNLKSLSGYQLFVSGQGNGLVGFGAFAGYGVSVQKSSSDGPLSLASGQTGLYEEVDAGNGPFSVGAGLQATPRTDPHLCSKEDPNGNALSASNPGYAVGVPIAKPGQGIGFYAGVGGEASGTIATPTFGQLYSGVQSLFNVGQ